jgi:hypothetical protein
VLRLLALVTSVAVVHAAPFRATLTTGTHRPAVGTRWPYTVKVADNRGRPLGARLSVAVVDPRGTVHPTQYYASTRYVTNVAFRGTFRDAVRFPPASKGYPLLFRVTVAVGAAKRVLRVTVVPS